MRRIETRGSREAQRASVLMPGRCLPAGNRVFQEKKAGLRQACPFEQPEVPAIYQCVTHARSARIQRRSNRPVQCAKVVVPARLREVVRLQDHPRPVRQSGNVKQRLREERVLAQMIVVDPPDCAVAAT